MREGIEGWWAGEARGPGWALLGAALAPAEWAFRAGVSVRTLLYDQGILPARGGEIPVVSVGNLSVGGTGKTPVSSWVVRLLQARGHRPALVTRGYGADEIALHRRWTPQVPVLVAPDRVAGVRQAEEGGADVAVVDDGFQHRRLARDLDLVLVSAEQGLPGRLLPRGPFREPRQALRRAGAVVVTRKSASPERSREVAREVRRAAPRTPVVEVSLDPCGWGDLKGNAAGPPEGPVLVVSSVAQPATVLEVARRALGLPQERSPDCLVFPDHHPYTLADARRIAGALPKGGTVVTTEKDAVKLEALEPALPDLRVLRLEVRVEEGRGVLEGLLGRIFP